MKTRFTLALSAALLFAPAIAFAAELHHTSVAGFVTAFKGFAQNCTKNELGKITKVEALNAKEVAKLTKRGFKGEPAKYYVVIHAQRGKAKTWEMPGDTVTSNVTSAELTKALSGSPICTLDEGSF